MKKVILTKEEMELIELKDWVKRLKEIKETLAIIKEIENERPGYIRPRSI